MDHQAFAELLGNYGEFVGAIAIVVTLVYLALQMKQNTSQLQRNEHNTTMAQWSTIRMALAENRDLAEIWSSGLSGEAELDAVDQLRLESLLAEQLWAAYHVWERTKRGLLTEGTFQEAVAPLIPDWLSSPRGALWWRTGKRNYPRLFAADVDSVLTRSRDSE